MTMDTYSHVLPTMQREAMDKLNHAIGIWGIANEVDKTNSKNDEDGKGN